MLSVDTGMVLDGYHAYDEASTSPYRIKDKFSLRGGAKNYEWLKTAQSSGAALREIPTRDNIQRELSMLIFPRFSTAYTNLCTNPVPASLTGYSDVGSPTTTSAYDSDRRAISVGTAATSGQGIRYAFTATAAAYSGGCWVLAPLGAAMQVGFDGAAQTAFVGTGQPQFVKTQGITLTVATRYLQVTQTTATAQTFYVWFTTIVLGSTFPTGADGRPATFHGACGDATWTGTANASTSTTLTSQTAVNHAIGRLAQIGDKAEAFAHRGGMGITQRLRSSPQETYGRLLAAEITENDYDYNHAQNHIAEIKYTMVLDPVCYGPERLATTVYRRAGQSLATGTISGIIGDLMATARIVFTPTGTEPQRYFAFGMQYRDYVSGSSVVVTATQMGVSGWSGTLTAAANEVQTIDRTGTISSGTYTLTCDGQTTSSIAYNANAATIQAALEALTNIGSGNVAVTGGPVSTTDVVLTFQSELAACNVPALTISTSLGGGGTAVMVQTTAGHGGYVAAALYDTWTTVCDTGNVTLVGPYRVTAVVDDRASTSDVGAAILKFVHGVGDQASTIEAPLLPSPIVVSDYSIVEFGRVDIPNVPTGTQRWKGRVVGITEGTLGASLRVVALRFEPLECGDGVIRSVNTGDGTLSMLDNFSLVVGAITGDTSLSGQTWASMGGLTDGDDFSKASGNAVQRTAVSDTSGIRRGRGVVLGSATPTDVSVCVDIEESAALAFKGVIAHFTDNDNFVTALHYNGFLYVYKVKTGSEVDLTIEECPGVTGSMTVELQIRSSGVWSASAMSPDGSGITVGGRDSDFASGTLAAGKSGLLDLQIGSGANTRTYSNFTVTIPSAEAIAAYANQPLEIRDSGDAWRKDSTGAVYSYPQKQTIPGPPKLGPAGPEGLTNRFVFDWSRFNPDFASHPTNDPGKVEVYYKPAYETATRHET